MPYIRSKKRADLDLEIDNLIERMRKVFVVKGDVNYAITRIVLGALRPDDGWSYTTLSEAIGVLRDSEVEIRRRLLDPYENQAIRQNGDVPEIHRELFRLIPSVVP